MATITTRSVNIWCHEFRKYFQTHFIDAAYHADPSKVPNAHPAWAFSDDVTELYFDSPEYLKNSFTCQWAAEKVGPDGANFSDFSAVLPMSVKETVVPLQQGDATETNKVENKAFVAMYFVVIKDESAPSKNFIDKFAAYLGRHASEEAHKLVVNISADAGFDVGAYFGGGSPIKNRLVFTITLSGRQSVNAIRKAQADFEDELADQLDLPNTWIGFGERAVVLDQAENITVSDSSPEFTVHFS